MLKTNPITRLPDYTPSAQDPKLKLGENERVEFSQGLSPVKNVRCANLTTSTSN